MKVKLIEVLNMIEDKTLKDDERVIIDSELFYYNQDDKKFYTVSNKKYQNAYRNIFTYKLDLECELIDRHAVEKEKIFQSRKIKELEYEHNFYSLSKYDELKFKADKISYLIEAINDSVFLSLKNKEKINELVIEINMIKNNL